MASIISNTCLLSSSSSSPATFTAKTHHHQHTNLHVTTSFKPISHSHHKKKHNLPNLITFVTSNVNNNNSNTLVLEANEQNLTWENETPGIDNGVSEWDGIPVARETEEYYEPPEDTKIFVGNLPYDVDSEQLAQLFQQAGVVEISEVIYNRETDQSRGFGFVTMSTVEEADKAVEMLHRYELGGRYITVNKAALKGSRPERTNQISGPSYRAYVGNLPWDADDVRLEQIFSEYGKVVNARVVYDRDSGRSRGFGFVTMSSESELNDAIENLDGQSFGGRAIRVNVAEEKPRRF